MSKEKGAERILNALNELDSYMVSRVDFVGDGPNSSKYRQIAKKSSINVIFHGFVEREKVHAILAESHFLLLPSSTEGFPKVIAEASCFGCIPIVSDVGSIGDYVKDKKNGFLWPIGRDESFASHLRNAMNTPAHELGIISKEGSGIAEKFIFENYKLKLEKQVLDDPARTRAS